MTPDRGCANRRDHSAEASAPEYTRGGTLVPPPIPAARPIRLYGQLPPGILGFEADGEPYVLSMP